MILVIDRNYDVYDAGTANIFIVILVIDRNYKKKWRRDS